MLTCSAKVELIPPFTVFPKPIARADAMQIKVKKGFSGSKSRVSLEPIIFRKITLTTFSNNFHGNFEHGKNCFNRNLFLAEYYFIH